jgi:hypothetical protein
MTTEETQFQWSDIISITENTYTTYLKLNKKDRDKYIKTQVKVEFSKNQLDDIQRFTGISDPMKMIRSQLTNHRQDEMCKMILKHMKYHCGKPLKLTLSKDDRYKPINDYFVRNAEYLSDYDYILMDQRQYISLLNNDFPLFNSDEWKTVSTYESSSAISKIAKYRNLDVYVTWHFPDKDIQSSERLLDFDCIIGKRDWVETDVIRMEPIELPLSLVDKSLVKVTFPIKRGFMKIKSI